jgi:hypothetical protein
MGIYRWQDFIPLFDRKKWSKNGAMINYRGQPIKFPKTDASHF